MVGVNRSAITYASLFSLCSFFSRIIKINQSSRESHVSLTVGCAIVDHDYGLIEAILPLLPMHFCLSYKYFTSLSYTVLRPYVPEYPTLERVE